MKSVFIIILSLFSFKSCLQTETDLYVVMNDAYGLQKSDKVKCMGVEVGKIKDIKIVGNKVIADVDLNDNYQPTKESSAKVTLENIFNKKSLVIIPAESTLPLEKGDTIYAQNSTGLDMIQDAIKQVNMDSILKKSGLDSVSFDLSGDSSTLNSLLKKAERILKLNKLLN